MVGSDVFAGGLATREVAGDAAVADPAELLAVTETRIVEPTSAEVKT
jgi:hypothetical protein